MRITFALIFIALIVALTICHKYTRKSNKAIAFSVAMLIGALIPPLIGNLIIVLSIWELPSTIGYYIYFLGMDMIMYALIQFALDYCMVSRKHRRYRYIAYVLLGIDVIQYMVNPVTGHCFATEQISVEGAAYYRLIPYLGQTYHRIVDYGILGVVLILFFVKMVSSPRINSERYSVILSAMIITTVWETAYIFSRTPIDRAMIGFGVFGLLIYYLTMYYRPMRLLDSMLAHMASEIPEALFFFDANDECIWANRQGIELLGVQSDNFDYVPDRLHAMFGDYSREEASQREATVKNTTRSFVLEKHNVKDDRKRLIGSFLSIRDNTLEQETLKQEIFNATHDSLTSLYNRAGYDLLLTSLELETTYLLLIDGDNFKSVNDNYGHETGDRMIKKMADTIRRNFRPEDYVCRIGGDEFVVFVTKTSEEQRDMIISRINKINEELAKKKDGLPPLSISVGIAHGKGIEEPAKLFEQADQSLYETKNRGKHGYSFYTKR